MINTLGIDVGSSHLDVALLLSDQSQTGRFTNDATGIKKLRKWTSKWDPEQSYQVCLEATGRFSDQAALYFHQQGHAVHVVNPARINAYHKSLLKRNKTDLIAAQVIAQFGSTQPMTEWAPPSDHQREIQEISRHLTFLKGERTRVKNRLKSGLTSQEVLDSLTRQLAALEQEIAQLQASLISQTKSHPDSEEAFELLDSISGIGELTAANLLAEIGDFKRFDNPKQLVAHAGLSPSKHQSGTSVKRKGRISKTGNVHLRRMLYMPALVAMRHNPPAIALASRLRDKGKPNKVIICAVMRKLLHIAFGVIKHGKPFDRNYLNANLQDSP